MFQPQLISRHLLGVMLISLLLTACGDADDDKPSAEEDVAEVVPPLEAVDGDLVPRFEPDRSDFYRMPWPSDARLGKDGSVDLADIPQADDNFVALYLEALKAVHGYSTMPVIYIPFLEAETLDTGALPTPQETLKPGASVQLIELSETGCGTRTPLEIVYDAEGGKFIDPQTLKVAPMPGWVLRPATPYALIVSTDFGGEGRSTARTQLFTDYLNGEGADAALTASFAPLHRCLPQTGLALEDIAIATVFHTQDPVAETRKMRDVVWREQTPLKALERWELVAEASDDSRKVYLGDASFPIFQKGTPPYDSEGGLVFDEAGDPVIQRWESVPFIVVVPPAPTGPLNLLVWEDGTGATLGGALNDRHWQEALKQGFAIATFVPQFHKYRGPGNADPVMHSFNYLNPASGRTVFRQQAAETSYFIRLLTEQIVHRPELPEIDTRRVFYGGHSQGSLVGSLVAGIEPRIDTYVFSGVAGYLTETILSRKDPFDIAQLLQELLNTRRPIDRFHPMVQIAQIGADAVDTQNYAPHWTGWPEHPGGSNVLIINGQHDDTTSVLGMNALMCAADVPPVDQPGWDVDPAGLRGVQTYALPVRGNRTAFNGEPLTVGAYLNPDTAHFTLYRRDEASDAAVHFWVTSAQGVAEIAY